MRATAFVVGALCSASWAAGARPVVAVFGLDGKGSQLRQVELDQLTDFIGASLAESGAYQVVPPEELRAALNRQKADSYRQCYAQSCQIEVGKELAAEKSLAGSVRRFGTKCIVTLKLFDLAKATQETAGTGTGGCDADAILTSLRVALVKLVGPRVAGGLAGTPPVVVVPEVASGSYGDVDAEIRAAVEKATKETAEKQAREAQEAAERQAREKADAARVAQEAADREARSRAAQRDWIRIRSWIANDALAPKRRAEILQTFLATFGRDNQHAKEAISLLRKIQAESGMVSVPAGEFHMGCNPRVDSKCNDDERPGSTVYLEAFRIDETEVTVAAYSKCVDAGVCAWSNFRTKSNTASCNWGHSDRSDHPMNCVNWAGADTYCRWLGKRLPTETEWEKAARGTDGRKYPFGDWEISCANAIIHYGGNGCSKGSTWPAGSKPSGASPYGAKNMAGNVREWTSDWYNSRRAHHRSVRGGAWDSRPRHARASARYSSDPTSRLDFIGFRCAEDH